MIVIINIMVLTKPDEFSIPSIMPPTNTAQFKLPLSLGTEMNLFTNGSFSII